MEPWRTENLKDIEKCLLSFWAVLWSVNLKNVELARLEKANFTGLTHKTCTNMAD